MFAEIIDIYMLTQQAQWWEAFQRQKIAVGIFNQLQNLR